MHRWQYPEFQFWAHRSSPFQWTKTNPTGFVGWVKHRATQHLQIANGERRTGETFTLSISNRIQGDHRAHEIEAGIGSLLTLGDERWEVLDIKTGKVLVSRDINYATC